MTESDTKANGWRFPLLNFLFQLATFPPPTITYSIFKTNNVNHVTVSLPSRERDVLAAVYSRGVQRSVHPKVRHYHARTLLEPTTASSPIRMETSRQSQGSRCGQIRKIKPTASSSEERSASSLVCSGFLPLGRDLTRGRHIIIHYQHT